MKKARLPMTRESDILPGKPMPSILLKAPQTASL